MLGPGAEFDAIRSLVARWGPRARGIGDDGAVVDLPPGERLIASVDVAVENVHFRRDWLTPREIGWRATTAALSDLAAMGARPCAILSALAFPEEWRGALNDLGDGIGDAAAAARAPIVGGNLSRARELSITTTVLGTAVHPLGRSGAHPGDDVYVTGALGGPLLALRAWLAGAPPPAEARVRFARPVARLKVGAWLAARGATGAIDLSDGLAADAGHLAAASAVRVEIALESLPLFPGASPADAVASGEEYELLVTLPHDLGRRIADECARELGTPLTRIGSVASGEGDVVVTERGQRVALPPGHDHLSP